MIDRLIEKLEQLGNPSAEGLDPTSATITEDIREEKLELHGKTPKAVAEMFTAFNRELIDNLYDIVPAVKPQIAMYEKYGLEGIRAYIETIDYAKEKGMIVIGDIKRGDISTTAAAYAAHLEGVTIEGEYYDLWQEDAVTLNPYMGFDAIEPFIKACNERDKGLFVLVRTSNPSSKDLQELSLTQLCWGPSGGNTVYERAAEYVREWGKQAMGNKGYSKIGAVVGATFIKHSKRLRTLMPGVFFLVPGYGAQGGKASDIRKLFDKDGRGCIVNSSRGIIAAYKSDLRYGDHNFAEAARVSAAYMRDDIWGDG